jgi:hypothetical protein
VILPIIVSSGGTCAETRNVALNIYPERGKVRIADWLYP